jgi:hypothetical protein
MDEVVNLPPFPILATTSNGLYRHLASLRDWLLEQQDVLRPCLPTDYADQLKVPDNLASEDVWANVGVVDKFMTLASMQTIRMAWDSMLREHEDSWNSACCLRKRFEVVYQCQQTLAEAFVDPEQREARRHRATGEAQRRYAVLQEYLKNALESREPRSHDGKREQASKPDDEWPDISDYL